MGTKTSKMKPKNFVELAKQTCFSQDDLKQWYKSFISLYPNCRVYIEDFKKIYGELFPFGDASNFVQHIFQEFDLNKDGFVDFREFVIWLSVATSGNLEERLNRAFQLYDLNSNGYISVDEMTQIMRAIYRMVGIVDESHSDKRVNDIFIKFDENVDGNLSVKEFVDGTKEDPVIMKLLQCDWETKLIQKMETKLLPE